MIENTMTKRKQKTRKKGVDKIKIYLTIRTPLRITSVNLFCWYQKCTLLGTFPKNNKSESLLGIYKIWKSIFWNSIVLCHAYSWSVYIHIQLLGTFKEQWLKLCLRYFCPLIKKIDQSDSCTHTQKDSMS
jgi:hypothetical protein